MDQSQKQDGLIYGTVEEMFPNALFSVKLDDTGEIIKANIAGKMRRYRIRVLVGDKVAIQPDQYGSQHRIVKRFNQ